MFGLELLDQQPLWAFDRSIQDSHRGQSDHRPRRSRAAISCASNPNDEVYIDPGQATCDSLSYLNKGTTDWGTRPGWGPYDDDLDDYGAGHYCGSEKSIGYGTIMNANAAAPPAYASLNYDLSDTTTLFADVLIGVSKVKMFKDVTDWNYMDAQRQRGRLPSSTSRSATSTTGIASSRPRKWADSIAA